MTLSSEKKHKNCWTRSKVSNSRHAPTIQKPGLSKEDPGFVLAVERLEARAVERLRSRFRFLLEGDDRRMAVEIG